MWKKEYLEKTLSLIHSEIEGLKSLHVALEIAMKNDDYENQTRIVYFLKERMEYLNEFVEIYEKRRLKQNK